MEKAAADQHRRQDLGKQVLTLADLRELLELNVKSNALVIRRLDRMVELLSPPVPQEAEPRRMKTRDIRSPGRGNQFPSPDYVTEQYRLIERKKFALTSTMNYYEVVTKDPAIVLLITDSIIQFDWAPITTDSPMMSGTSTNLATITIGVKKLKRPVRVWGATLAGTGNLWIVVGE